MQSGQTGVEEVSDFRVTDGDVVELKYELITGGDVKSISVFFDRRGDSDLTLILFEF